MAFSLRSSVNSFCTIHSSCRRFVCISSGRRSSSTTTTSSSSSNSGSGIDSLGPSVSRTFRVLGIQQVAMGGLDKEALASFWGDAMGLKKVGTYVSEKENVDEDIYTIGSGALAVEVDLMQPLNPEISPKVHLPALNHIGLWVDSIENAVAELTRKGVKFTPGGIRKGASGHLVTFIHPKSACNVLVELVQAPEEIIRTLQTGTSNLDGRS